MIKTMLYDVHFFRRLRRDITGIIDSSSDRFEHT